MKEQPTETFDNHDDLYESHMRPYEVGIMSYEDCLENYVNAVQERLEDERATTN